METFLDRISPRQRSRRADFSRGRKINQRARSFLIVLVVVVAVVHCKRREIAGGGKTRPDESKKNSLPAGSSLEPNFLLP